MSESILKSILEESAKLEWDKYENVPEHKFSLKHRLAMKRIFKLYEKNTRAIHSAAVSKPKRFRLTRKTVLAAVVIAFLAALAGCTAAYFISQSFRGDVHKEFTRIFPINTANCPTTIEEKYYLPELPRGVEKVDEQSTSFFEYIKYKNSSTCQYISFSQRVKSEFGTTHFNTENHQIEEVDINGYIGLCVDFSDSERTHSMLMWDNGDYILGISADFTKKELINLEKTTKVSEN